MVKNSIEESSSESEEETREKRSSSKATHIHMKTRDDLVHGHYSPLKASSRFSKRIRKSSPQLGIGTKMNLKLDLPTFEGGTGVKNWICKFRIVTKNTSENERMRALVTALTGEASDWFLSEYESHPNYSVERWLDRIAKQFPTKCTQEVLMISSRKYVAGFHHPEHFVNRVVKTMTRLSRECCVTHKDQIMTVLKTIMRNHHPQWECLEQQFPGTPQELIGQLIQIEAESDRTPAP